MSGRKQERRQGVIEVIKIVQPESMMKPVEGTMREGLHAALDDLMDDIEKQPEARVGGISQIGCEKNGYRHTLTLTVEIVSQLISDPSLN